MDSYIRKRRRLIRRQIARNLLEGNIIWAIQAATPQDGHEEFLHWLADWL